MPSRPRPLLGLAPFEAMAILGLAIVPLPDSIPLALPLFGVATVSRWLRGRPWSQALRGGARAAGIGLLVGLAALAVALVIGTPVIERVWERSVEWSSFPIVRGSGMMLLPIALLVGASALATELALRGWVVERVLELAPGPALLPVLVGAVVEALITPGDPATRLGAGLFGIGLGYLFVAGGRSTLAPLCARLAFALGAVALEALRIV